MAMPIKDYSKYKFGAITPLYHTGNKYHTAWMCKCDCGNLIEKATNSLRQAELKKGFLTCGCHHITIDGEKKLLVGQVFDDSIVKSFNQKTKLYLCEDSNGKKEFLNNILVGRKIRCHFLKLKTKNKFQNFANELNCTDIQDYYKKCAYLRCVFYKMRIRCYNKDEWAYQYYGANGIKIYNKWLENPHEFINWSLKNGYDYGLQIDRIDNSKGYFPDNCRWTTRLQQANNKRNNIIISYNGEEHTMAEWCRILNLDYKSTQHKLKYKKMTLDEIVKQKTKEQAN